MLDGVLVTGLAWKPSHRMGLQGGGTELQLKLRGGVCPQISGQGQVSPCSCSSAWSRAQSGPHTPSITAHTPCARRRCGA